MKKFTKIKSIITIALAILMISAPLTTLAASNPSLPTATGSLTIHKYLMPDISLAGERNDGTTNVTIPSTATPLDGITFKLYKIEIPTTGSVPSNGDYPEPGYFFESYLNPIAMVSNGVTYPLAPATVPSVTTAGGGIAKASDLPQGFYLVIEQPDARVVDPAAPFVVAVPMTNATGSGWIQDVHVYPKNEDVSAHKKADKTVVNISDTVTWTIDVSVPTDIAAFTKFNIVDPLDEALDFVPSSLKLEGLLTEDAASGTLIDSSLYDVNLDSAQNLPTPSGSNTTQRKVLTVSFKKTSTFTAPSGTAYATVPAILANYKFVRMTFQTTVNSKILDRVEFTVYNGAKAEFTNRFSQDKERITEEPLVHTAKILINKIDATTGLGVNINGAKFKIASTPANATDAHYIRVQKDGSGNILRIVDFDQAGYNDPGMVDWEETVTGGTASNPGNAIFAGIADYTETNVKNYPPIAYSSDKTYLSYYLVETQAPAGYNLLAGPVTATFTAENSTATTSYSISVLVKNTNKFELPKTGGIGTILFTAGGVLLIGAAAFLVILGSRKRKENA